MHRIARLPLPGLCRSWGVAALLLAASPALPVHGAEAAPRLSGVEAVHVLSDRWVVVVTSNAEEIAAEIDRLSTGQLKPAAEAWDATKDKERKDWTSKRHAENLRAQYIARARAGEAALDLPSSYAVGSIDDPRYGTAKAPLRVGRTLVGVGAGRVTGAPDVEFGHYSYLELPEPMERGRTYTVTVQGAKSTQFLFDEDQTISRAIKVNQVGYIDSAPRKYAYAGSHLYDIGPLDLSAYPTFAVVNEANGEVALEGPLTLRDKNSRVVPGKRPAPADGAPAKEAPTATPPLITGEDVYELDISALTAPGTYYIRIPGVGRSWSFRVGPDVYGEAFYVAARGLYHQRCGVAYDPAHTPWRRAKCHTDPIYESAYLAFPYGDFGQPKNYVAFAVYLGSMDFSRKTENVWGGWHDAADWDRRNQHYVVLFDLLHAYEIAPGNFSDGQLNLPESSNGIPDILDEAAFGLEVWARSMTSEGGVSGYVETTGHVPMNSDRPYAFSRRTRWDSLLFAAAAAQLAEHLKPVKPEAAARWAELATRAFDFGSDPANSVGRVEIPAKSNRNNGERYSFFWEEKERYLEPFLLMARARMYWLTGEERYLEGVKALMIDLPRPYAWPYTLMDYSPWFYFSLCHREDSFLPEAQRKSLMASHLLPQAEKLVALLDEGPYRQTWPKNQSFWMAFGASDMTNAGRALLIAHALTGEARYREAAILNFDFMLGANPLGMSWTTGLGEVYPVNIQHEVSETDGIADPVPGITIYGISGAIANALRDRVWRVPSTENPKQLVDLKVSDVPLWRRWMCHPTLNVGQCEFTVQETMSSTIFCSAVLLSEGWQPPESLRTRQPRPESRLHGLWYLP